MNFNQSNFNSQGGRGANQNNNGNQFSLALLQAMMQQQQQSQQQSQSQQLQQSNFMSTQQLNPANLSLPASFQNNQPVSIGAANNMAQQPVMSFPNVNMNEVQGAPSNAVAQSNESAAQSSYRDFSGVPCESGDDGNKKRPSKGNKSTSKKFPMKLFDMLSREEFSEMIAWAPHGRSWRVLKPKAFESEVLPQYFTHGKYNSFMRQVNGWGFRRISQGPDFNSYYHEYFLRGMPHLCARMRRKAIARGSAETYYDPDFRKMRPLPMPSPSPKKRSVDGSLRGEDDEQSGDGSDSDSADALENFERPVQEPAESSHLDQNTSPQGVPGDLMNSASVSRLMGNQVSQNSSSSARSEAGAFSALASVLGNNSNGFIQGNMDFAGRQQMSHCGPSSSGRKLASSEPQPVNVPSSSNAVYQNGMVQNSNGFDSKDLNQNYSINPQAQRPMPQQMAPVADYLSLWQQQQQPHQQIMSQRNGQVNNGMNGGSSFNEQISAFLNRSNLNNN
jgi:hypothetical protein